MNLKVDKEEFILGRSKNLQEIFIKEHKELYQWAKAKNSS
jgi:hypothetical protein